MLCYQNFDNESRTVIFCLSINNERVIFLLKVQNDISRERPKGKYTHEIIFICAVPCYSKGGHTLKARKSASKKEKRELKQELPHTKRLIKRVVFA